MKQKYKLLNLITLVCTFFSLTVNANIISYGNGNITSDINSELIIDHLNQREYLRFDVLGKLTYQEQLEVTTVGKYSDFSIANHLINHAFIESLLDGKTGACTATRNENGYCNKLSANQEVWVEGNLGFSFDSNADYWLFENQQNGAFQDFGLAGMLKNGAILSFQNWHTLNSANNLGKHAFPVHFLMYRDIKQASISSLSVKVPEPSNAVIFLLALGIVSTFRYINFR